MELERREYDIFSMSKYFNVNFSPLLTTSKFALVKIFFAPSGLVSEVASKFFQPLKKSKLNLHCARLVSHCDH